MKYIFHIISNNTSSVFRFGDENVISRVLAPIAIGKKQYMVSIHVVEHQ